MSTIKNLIFDLDNTLYDFSTIWKESNKLVYKYLKYDKIASYEEFFRHYKAINNILVDEVLKGNMKLREIRNKRLKLTLEKFGIILTEEDCNIYYEKQFDFIIESIKPNEEVNLWLSRLCKKYKMILLTNGKSYEQREKLAKLGLENLFELYISGETHISKPKAEAFINVLEKENIVASETMMIGDSLYYDINPANKLGMKTCLVERKWHFDDELQNYTGYKVKNIIQFFTELETNKL
ncbi:HAD family hydrolase [Gemella haemolysans]|uniref:HAD hydrolase, family IA, variant 1 n=1 Tax=Gemella haemolysans ATCC 10379 TaxID=546270 RepID=C5NUL1_9BACL|nr:HAD family hydrolase [Gemella haemolysans]EER69046.1 HAD hydrolase, family IA, variant 1 [Gemella haemolysans ATCC 10379]KAA8708126.1 HAD family hydrolase [Gemella haemolysans]UBH82101.1 HAD family hydrolase [Gemella haemolysans]VEI37981.1 Putative HAD-hydrolase yfnB [Gemella haemolysans]